MRVRGPLAGGCTAVERLPLAFSTSCARGSACGPRFLSIDPMTMTYGHKPSLVFEAAIESVFER